MECPHLVSDCKINRDFVKTKKCQLIDRCTGAPVPIVGQSSSTPNKIHRNDVVIVPGSAQKIWKCEECDSKNNWLCLYCGIILCGRYEKGHALHHFNTKHHKVCMNILELSVYCYKCDDFIVNETRQIDDIRHYLKSEDDASSETSSTTTNTEESSSLSGSSTSTKSSSHSNSQETASISSNDSGWEEPRQTASGRKLRPRKRTNSNDSAEGNNTSGVTSTKQQRKTPRKSNVIGTLSNSKANFKVVGLRNLGNTCFMNSVLQSLSNIQEFSCYFSALPSLDHQTNKQKQRVYHSRSLKENLNDANVVEELRKVLINLSKGGDGHKAISPECLFLVIWKVVPQFRGHRQHDAHEFLRYMLDRLHTELQHLPNNIELNISTGSNNNSPTKTTQIISATFNGKFCTSTIQDFSSGNGGGGNINNPCSTPGIYNLKGSKSSIVTNVFGGTLQSEVRCLICGMESKKHDPFLDLSLDIPEKFFKDCSNPDDANSSESKPVCNIKDCLSSFTEVEELAETELYYCNSCKCKQKSTKRFWIRRLPNVLCLHIKRFRWNNFFRTKIDLRISFPIKSLDMSQYVLNNGPETRRNSQLNNVYDLAAVIVHHGNGSSCGHYTSYAINNGTWLHFNDHTVKEVPPTAVADCKPYILFYIRRDPTTNSSTTSSPSSSPISLSPISTLSQKSSPSTATITSSTMTAAANGSGNNNCSLNKTL